MDFLPLVIGVIKVPEGFGRLAPSIHLGLRVATVFLQTVRAYRD
jgi:hypothetical protein